MGKIPWRRKWQPTPVFLPGESHGQRSLVGYSPWGCKELNTAEQPTQTHTCTPLVELTLSPLYLLWFLLGKWCSCLCMSIYFKSCFLYLFMATPRSMWDLSSLAGYRTRDPAMEAQCPNSWATRGVLYVSILEQFRRQACFQTALHFQTAVQPAQGWGAWGGEGVRSESRSALRVPQSGGRGDRRAGWGRVDASSTWDPGLFPPGPWPARDLSRWGCVPLSWAWGCSSRHLRCWLPCRLWVQFECV